MLNGSNPLVWSQCLLLRKKKTVSKVHQGKPWPLGSSITNRGVNFCVAAPTANHVELLLFNSENEINPHQIIHLDEENRSGNYWHVEVEGVGEGCCYCYRVFRNEKHQLTPTNDHSNKALLDPCARAIGGWSLYKRELAKGNSSNLHACLKGIVCDREEFDFASHPRPKHTWNQTVIYELHPGGFTNRADSKVKAPEKGTFIGLIEKIPYLRDLGITTLELLPIFSFDSSDCQQGLENYWGYSPINWFTPHHNYIVGEDPLKAREQVRNLVAACHDQGMEVLLDVVYNHTAEGSKEGPVISWKGFAESIYYFQQKSGGYHDVSGCGNSIAANRPLVRQLILESMRCWAIELGIDGFRFDLGIALTRGEELSPLSNPPLFEEIESDPQLSDLKLISEPWDCGGLYRISNFPSKKTRTWNGHFRDDLRRFWKGEKNSVWALKDRLRGSQELYKDKQSHLRSVNFITSHDGFTLNDLVSFRTKHNLANGEKNRDGENQNNSWNNNIEGPSTDIGLTRLRDRQKRNLLVSLLLSPGIPMLLMGDEVGRSQGGNNNTWCQNNQLGWMIWDPQKSDLALLQFVKKVLAIRRQLHELINPIILPNEIKETEENSQDKLWVKWHGVKVDQPDWGHWSHTISFSINKGSRGAIMWTGLNSYKTSMDFELPEPISSWEKLLDTSMSNPDDVFFSSDFKNQKLCSLKSKSLVVLLDNQYRLKVKL